jgi:hypothetical protein
LHPHTIESSDLYVASCLEASLGKLCTD